MGKKKPGGSDNRSKEEMEDDTISTDQTSVTLAESEVKPCTDQTWSELPSEYTRERPLTVLVGPERHQYHVHRGLCAAKSPFFRTILKDQWDGKKDEIEIHDISSCGFGVVVDWMYSGQLPDRAKEYSKDDPRPWDNLLQAYKAADVLMIDKLQNTIMAHEIALFKKHGISWRLSRLQAVHENGLCHTKYYDFVLSSATKNMMTSQKQPEQDWEDDMSLVESNAQLLGDLVRKTREWVVKPWMEFPNGDMTAFYITEMNDQQKNI